MHFLVIATTIGRLPLISPRKISYVNKLGKIEICMYSFFHQKGMVMTWQPKDELASAVALEVLIHGPLGRAELARRLGLAPATLTRISTELISSGLLAEVPEATQRTSGRPTIPLDVVPSSHYFLGIKLTDSALDATVIDLKATPRDSYRVPLESLTPVRVVRAIADLAHQARASYCIDAIGIAVGGIVNADGAVESAPFLKWNNVPLASLVSEATHLPTFVANDLSAYTQIQHWFGSGTGHSNFAVITVGVGVGYGCVANGARLENEDSGIGLVGHWPLDPLGPICSQGHRGCAEAMLTTPAICRDASAAVGHPLEWSDVIALASDKHPAVTAILAASGRALGRLIGLVASLTAPELVIVGGEGVALASLSGEALRAGIAEVRDPRASSIRVTLSDGSNEAWSRGAGVIALQGFIASRAA